MKRTINETELQRLIQDGAVEVTRDMILTPSAREFAARKGIRLRYQENRSRAQAPLDGVSLGHLIEEVVVQEIARVEGAPSPPPTRAADAPPPPLGEQLDAVRTEILDPCGDAPIRGGRGVIAVIGTNRPGIVARISTAVASAGGDLADMSQVIVDNYFSLIFLVNLDGLEANGVSFRVFKERLKDEAAAIGQVEVLVMHERIFRAMHEV
ncbi:MAG: ACT domain-containing protein [Pseudomonadota bacterium]